MARLKSRPVTSSEDSETKGVAATPPPPPQSAAAPAEESPPPQPKDDTGREERKKKRMRLEEEPKKSALIQRMWTEEEELVVLQGLLEFNTQRGGAGGGYDKPGFHDYINESLHNKFDMNQIAGKVRRLKRRFTNSIGKKARKNSSSNDQKALALSANIWGSEPPRSDDDDDEASDPAPAPTKADLEAKWKQLHLEEIHIFLKRLALIQEETSMIINALNSHEV